ncbi:MAG: LamG domain-containing protein, partial [Candidatus Omnitrophica bacterium]|nr:LamG domain-containing protein [Candidatus Omnitrophota bacterium]
WTGDTYAPGAVVYANDVDINGTFTMTAPKTFVHGGWDATGGSFSFATTSQVIFTSTFSETITSNSNTFNDVIVNDGLIGYWKFDELTADTCDGGTNDACDSSGYGNDGAWTSGAVGSSFVTSLNFVNLGSLSLDGSNDYVDAGTAIAPSEAITICAWVYNETWGTSADQDIIVRTSTSNAGNFVFEFNDDTRDAGAHRDLQFGAGGDNGVMIYSGVGGVIELNTWNHLCAAYSNADGGNIYVNGTSQASATGAGSNLTTNSETLFIGGRSGASDCMDGFLDEVRIYDRVLSASEIAQLAAANHPGTGVGVYTLQDDMDVDGDLILFAGTMDTGANRAITLVGNWQNDGGSFVENTGTVTLDGTDQTITSSETYYNLTKTVSSAASLLFGTSATVTVTNDLTLEGAVGEELTLQGSSSGTQSYLTVNQDATYSMKHMILQDIDSLGGRMLDADKSTNNGNNENLLFDAKSGMF